MTDCFFLKKSVEVLVTASYLGCLHKLGTKHMKLADLPDLPGDTQTFMQNLIYLNFSYLDVVGMLKHYSHNQRAI